MSKILDYLALTICWIILGGLVVCVAVGATWGLWKLLGWAYPVLLIVVFSFERVITRKL